MVVLTMNGLYSSLFIFVQGVDIPAGVANPTPSSTYGNPQKDNYVEVSFHR